MRATLERGLRSGLEMLRQHCIECRQLVRIPANSRMLTDLVNLDLNLWGAEVFDEATTFVARHESPPALEAFPKVLVPSWTRLSRYINAGGLHNSQHRHKNQSNPPSASRKGASKPYCHAFQPGNCTKTAWSCKYLHEIDPNFDDGNRYGGGGRGRGGGGNGGANRNDGSATASGGGGRNSRGGASGSGGGASQSGHGNGGGGSGGNGGHGRSSGGGGSGGGSSRT